MKCPGCGLEAEDGVKFCPQCGQRLKVVCPGCGKELSDNVRFCPECGSPLQSWEEGPVLGQDQSQQKTDASEEDKAGWYEKELEKKAKKENLGSIIALAIGAPLCLILIINNWGYADILEIAFKCGVISAIILAIESAAAAAMGFYGANKYLRKYRQMKEEIGKVEAIKMIEQQYKPEEGFALMKGGINATGGCVGGCLSSIVGFAITIIAVVLLMAFC